MTPHHSGHGGKGVWSVPGMAGTSLLLVLSAMAAGTLGQFFQPDPRFADRSTLNFYVETQVLGWWEANWRNYGDRRLAPLTPALREFLLADPARFSGWHWIGAKRLHSRWTWLDGTGLLTCGGQVDTGPMSPSHTLTNGSDAFTCFMKCRTQYFVLQDVHCYCLDAYPSQRLLSEGNTCPSNIYCMGDRTRGNLYEYEGLGPLVSWSSDADDGFWAYAKKVGSGIVLHTSRHRGSKKHFLCKTTHARMPEQEQTYSITPDSSYEFICAPDLCSHSHGNKLGWSDSKRLCRRYPGTDLVSLTRTDPVELLKLLGDQEYWVGLSRSLVWKNVDGTDVEPTPASPVPFSSLCLSVSVHNRSRNSFGIVTRPKLCYQPLPFILETVSGRAVPLVTQSPPDGIQSSTAPEAYTVIPANVSTPGADPDASNSSSLPVDSPNNGGTNMIMLGVGLGIGAVILLAIVAFVCVLKRKSVRCPRRSNGTDGDDGAKDEDSDEETEASEAAAPSGAGVATTTWNRPPMPLPPSPSQVRPPSPRHDYLELHVLPVHNPAYEPDSDGYETPVRGLVPRFPRFQEVYLEPVHEDPAYVNRPPGASPEDPASSPKKSPRSTPPAQDDVYQSTGTSQADQATIPDPDYADEDVYHDVVLPLDYEQAASETTEYQNM